MTTQYTNDQLKRTLAKMLPNAVGKYSTGLAGCEVSDEEIERLGMTYGDWVYVWKGTHQEIKDTELLGLCFMVEERLKFRERLRYKRMVYYHSTWQQRTVALAQIWGIEIV